MNTEAMEGFLDKMVNSIFTIFVAAYMELTMREPIFIVIYKMGVDSLHHLDGGEGRDFRQARRGPRGRFRRFRAFGFSRRRGDFVEQRLQRENHARLKISRCQPAINGKFKTIASRIVNKGRTVAASQILT